MRTPTIFNPKGFAWVGLFAQDIDLLAQFYENVLGLRLIEGDERCKIFDAGNGALFEIWGRGMARSRKTPLEQSMIVGILVEQLEPVVAGLRARGLKSDTEIDSYLGTRWIYFTDPEGNRFELKDTKGSLTNSSTPLSVPTLETDRLLLLPPDSECDSVYQRFYTDAEASEPYGGPLTPSGAWSRLASDIGMWQLQRFGVWVIHRRDERDLVGACGFWQGRGWPRELTWWLLPNARGQGIAHEASLAAINHAYKVLRWESVETYMNDNNKSARSLALRLGGVKTDRRRFPDGLERDVFLVPPPTEA
jgi:[ribosomal protein S5]-alanine N-acetyltransferase